MSRKESKVSNKRYEPGQDVMVEFKGWKRAIKCKVIKPIGYVSLEVEDIDYTPPDKVAVGGKGWSRNTNLGLGHKYEIHVNQIVSRLWETT